MSAADSIVGRVIAPPPVASVGKVYKLDETWHCGCGLIHSFGAYAAGHWDEPLEHNCKCGAVRVFENGEVLSLS